MLNLLESSLFLCLAGVRYQSKRSSLCRWFCERANKGNSRHCTYECGILVGKQGVECSFHRVKGDVFAQAGAARTSTRMLDCSACARNASGKEYSRNVPRCLFNGADGTANLCSENRTIRLQVCELEGTAPGSVDPAATPSWHSLLGHLIAMKTIVRELS